MDPIHPFTKTSAMEVLAVAARNVALLIAHGRVEDGNGAGAAEKSEL